MHIHKHPFLNDIPLLCHSVSFIKHMNKGHHSLLLLYIQSSLFCLHGVPSSHLQKKKHCKVSPRILETQTQVDGITEKTLPHSVFAALYVHQLVIIAKNTLIKLV